MNYFRPVGRNKALLALTVGISVTLIVLLSTVWQLKSDTGEPMAGELSFFVALMGSFLSIVFFARMRISLKYNARIRRGTILRGVVVNCTVEYVNNLLDEEIYTVIKSKRGTQININNGISVKNHELFALRVRYTVGYYLDGEYHEVVSDPIRYPFGATFESVNHLGEICLVSAIDANDVLVLRKKGYFDLVTLKEGSAC